MVVVFIASELFRFPYNDTHHMAYIVINYVGTNTRLQITFHPFQPLLVGSRWINQIFWVSACTMGGLR